MASSIVLLCFALALTICCVTANPAAAGDPSLLPPKALEICKVPKKDFCKQDHTLPDSSIPDATCKEFAALVGATDPKCNHMDTCIFTTKIGGKDKYLFVSHDKREATAEQQNWPIHKTCENGFILYANNY